MKTLFDNRRDKSKTEWLTPPDLLNELGKFDLDPCAPINLPWKIADKHYNIIDNGLFKTWNGRIWLNPPYDKTTYSWINKLSNQNGIALIFARTDTKIFNDIIWKKADSILFLSKRITFFNVDGSMGNYNSGAPSCLVAFGKNNTEYLLNLEKHKKYYGKVFTINGQI